jgi:hypothetical protein
MARENQGLHITLIFFVLFTVIFGAMTWVFYSKSTEMEKKAAEERNNSEKARQATETAETNAKEMGKLIFGPSATGDADVAKNQFEKDMKEYGAGLKAEDQRYQPLVKKLAGLKADKEAELKKKIEEIAAFKIKYEDREKSKDGQIKEFREAAQKATDELAAAKADFDKRRTDTESLAKKLQDQLAEVRTADAAEIDKLTKEVENLKKSLVITKGSLKETTTELNNSKRTIVDIPDGEIRWVNQRTGLVWINVGRDDGLQPLMTFSVFPSDVSDLRKGDRKGAIEVTQILDGHMAEARITNDSITDPFMPGDKIDTALWNPGERLHFALAGLMDVDGDGQSDLELVKNLITMNNGVVDCYEDEKGMVHGLDEMSINTRFLVKGDEGRKEANVVELSAGISQMKTKADELGVQIINLQTLLQRMGYKAPVSTKPTGDDEAGRHSTTGKSRDPRNRPNDQFEPRQPPDAESKP